MTFNFHLKTIAATIVLVASISAANAGAIHDSNLYTNVLPANDDGSTGQIALGFSANINNTTYTNVMARWNLRLAIRMVRKLAAEDTQAYQRLVQLGDALLGLIRRSTGRDNKTLASFAESLRKLIEKFEF